MTGARSEYGMARPLLRRLQDVEDVDIEIYPNGMHLLDRFGNTMNEIIQGDFLIPEVIHTYTEDGEPKAVEFARSLTKIYETLERQKPDAVFVIGDRIEAYSAALAAHFLKLPVIHSGGGNLTMGAVDNVYRFNITNIASLHFATSKTAWERLIRCPLVDMNTVILSGSPTVDAIIKFQQTSISISSIIRELRNRKFALMTFHPVTTLHEPISDLMQYAIDCILSNSVDVLLTYPNNDTGADLIIEVIEKNANRSGVYIQKNLGIEGYYAALRDCTFVIGNSSSGIMEAPYFHKPVINIGTRQQGRDKDVGIKDVEPTTTALEAALREGFTSSWPEARCNNLYGDGKAVARISKAIIRFLHENSKHQCIGRIHN